MSFQQASWVGGTFGRIQQVGRTSNTARGYDDRQGLIGTGQLTRQQHAALDAASAKRRNVTDPLPGRRRGERFDPACPGLIVKRVGKQPRGFVGPDGLRYSSPGVLLQED